MKRVLVLSLLACALVWPAHSQVTNSAKAAPKKRQLETAFTTLDAPGWIKLFDGKTLQGWKETDFYGRKPVQVKDGQIILQKGNDMTGVTWTNVCLRMNYEIVLEAKRVEGDDFFCCLTFPVDTNSCSLVCGGWGGSLVGISSLDGSDASNNQTASTRQFENGKWYRIRVRVTAHVIEAWIDQDSVVDIDVTDKSIDVRHEVDASKPMGIATWRTTGAARDIRWRPLETK